MIKVALVPNQHDRHTLIRILSGLFQPASEVVEGLTSKGKVMQTLARGC